MKIDYKAIFKLKIMLDNANIPYEFLDRSYRDERYEEPFYQIIVYEPNQNDFEEPIRLISVVQGRGTYGESQDLLEIQGCLTKEESNYDSVLGCLTAIEVFERIKKNYSKELVEK